MVIPHRAWALLVVSPQGSVPGPKWFILYINNICNISKILNLVLFADDTGIFCPGVNLQELLEVFISQIGKLKRWFD